MYGAANWQAESTSFEIAKPILQRANTFQHASEDKLKLLRAARS